MVLYIAQRSAGVLRSLPRTLAGIHTQVKRVSPVTNGVLANANVLPLGVRVGLLTTRSSYATSTSTGSGAKKTTGTTRKSSSTTASGTKKTTKSTATKKKTPVKKKTTTKKKAKKPAPKPKKKVLSEKQKKDREDKKQREQLKELKIQILAPPKKLADNQWAVGFQHKLTDALSANQKGAEAFRTATDLTRALSEEEKEVRVILPSENDKCMDHEGWLTKKSRDSLLSLKTTRQPTSSTTIDGSSPTRLCRSRKPTWPDDGCRRKRARTCARLTTTAWSSVPARRT